MAARDTGKNCSRCGQFKSASDFYVHRRTKCGNVILSPKCKSCRRKVAADRKRKGNGEYRTIDEIRENKKPVHKRLSKWDRAVQRQYTRLVSEANGDVREQWKRRCKNAYSLLVRYAKVPLESKPKAITRKIVPHKSHRQRSPWKARCVNAECMLRKRARERLRRLSS